MAPTSERPSTSLAKTLAKQPWKFDFFQAVRLIERIGQEDANTTLRTVGQDGPPAAEMLRFRALPSFSFPPGTVSELTGMEQFFSNSDTTEIRPFKPVQMVVPFIGLYGPNGVLPRHYTQLVIDSVRRKDHALRNFLDLFNHRATAFFYRAWEKYRFPLGYERASLAEGGKEDLFTYCLYSLVGLGPESLRKRMDLDDRALLYYAPHFAQHPRSASALTSIVGDFFQVPTSVLQFKGQWLYLDETDQSQLSAVEEVDGLNCCLGENVIVGDRVWGIENKFRLRLGPFGYQDFRRFTPFGDRLVTLGQWVRTFVGPEFDFDILLVLKAEEIPPCQLGDTGSDPAYLGWNTWLISETPASDASDAVFVSEGVPTR